MTYFFANVLYLYICMQGNCLCFYFRLLTFFKIKFLQINHPGPPSKCQTVWIQIKTDIPLVFIWVQIVCKSLFRDDKILRWHAKSYNRLYMVHTNGECRALNQRAKRRHFCLLFQKYHDLLSNVTL